MDAPHIETAPSSNPVQINADMKQVIDSMRVYFEPYQAGSGDPSPSNVRPITGLTGVDVCITGENILGNTYVAAEYVNNTVGQPLQISYTNTWRITTTPVRVSPGMTLYCYRNDNTEMTPIILYLDENKNYLTSSVNYTHGAEVPQGAYFFVIQISYADLGGYVLSMSTSDTHGYVHYFGETIHVDWTSEAGTVYGGYVDLVTGDVVADRALVTTPSWTMRDVGGTTPWIRLSGSYLYSSSERQKSRAMWVCSKARTAANSGANIPTSAYNYGIWQHDSAIARIYLPSGSVLTDAEAYMENIQIVYPLATPTTVATLTPQQISALKGVNNIWSNANGNVSVTYWTH